MTSQNIFPAIRYRDGDRALEWLKDAFGFEEKAIYRADQPYGSREYGARDLEGNEWSFGTYSPHDD